jgi:NADH-quinone oxidoreductase subunit L
MFVALGVGAYAAGIFHLFTHAFFKALLFLGAGSVIHAMHHEQDMRNMGALRRSIPFTAAMMTIGTLALIGFPGTAGYFSKDAIIEAAYASDRPGHAFAFLATVAAAFMTSFYSWRLFFMTFEGPARWGGHGHHGAIAATQPGHHEGVDHDGRSRDVEPASASAIEHHDHAPHKPHESPRVMLIPLAVLAIGSLFAGLLFTKPFIGYGMDAFWKGSLAVPKNGIYEAMHHVPWWVAWSPTFMLVAGFFLAFTMYIYRPYLPGQLAAQHPSLYRFLLNKWYFDELYDFIFVRPAKWLGRFFWKRGDGWMIDRLGPDGISARVVDVTRGVVRLQTGYLYHYAFVMLTGVALILAWYLVTGSR